MILYSLEVLLIMNGLKVVCIILIVLGLCACGFGIFRKTMDANTVPALPDMPHYDMSEIGQGSITLDLTENAEPDGEITSTNGDIVEG